MYKIQWYKRCLSYFLPITITRQSSDRHPNLKIKYYLGQWQLESNDALYSDGYRYSPFRKAFDYLNKKGILTNTTNFLLLGGGLGSAVARLYNKYKCTPTFTLVEHDKKIIELGQQFLELHDVPNARIMHTDANSFLKSNTQQYDLLGIDLFDGLANSPLIHQETFHANVIKTLGADGHIILNTIFTNNLERLTFEQLLEQFYSLEIIERKPNYIYILQAKKD